MENLEKEMQEISKFIDESMKYDLEEILEVLKPYAHSVEWGVFNCLADYNFDPKEQFTEVYSKNGVYIQHNGEHNYMDVVGLSDKDFTLVVNLLHCEHPEDDYGPELEDDNDYYFPDQYDVYDCIIEIMASEYYGLLSQIEELKSRIKELEGE